MNNLLAFADEFGNNSFDFPTQGTHFIVASVIIPRDKKAEVEQQIEVIRKKYFQTGEMKSKGIGKNNNRRKQILSEILKVDFAIYALVVDKKKLEGEGFKYKKSFYKFLNGILYKELFKVYPNLHLAVDEHGENKFMAEFKSYVEKNHKPNLFSGSEFGFMASPDSILIQLADIIAGTLGRCFDESKKDECSNQFLELLKPKLTSINHFPRDKGSLIHIPENTNHSHNEKIVSLGRNLSYQFLDEIRSNNTTDYIDQVNCVKLLLLYLNNFGSDNYITTKEIIKHLQVNREDKLNEEYFRTNIIAKLRDKGLLIASSNKRGKKGGYKLPTTADDLLDFIDHGNSMIIPMLSRIKKCRDTIKMATQNELDLLDSDVYKELKRILDSQ